LWLSPHRHLDRCVLAFGCYDPDLHFALERLLEPGMVCLDVGANFGEVTLHMARLVGSGGAVHAFEPAVLPFTRLSRHVERNARHHGGCVRCYPVALSDRGGTIRMATPTEEAENQGLGSIVSAAPSGYATVDVTAQTLDQFVVEHRLERLDFVKLDIQGAEPLLVRGGLETIRRFRPRIVSEISAADLSAGGITSRQYCDMFTGLGYRIHRLTRRGVGRRIEAVNDDFEATNVLFVPPG